MARGANAPIRARNRRRSKLGISALPIETIAEFLARLDSDDPLPNPRADLTDVQTMRFGADDLKAYYLEAATVGPGRPSSRQLTDWFWLETLAARTLFDLRRRSIESEHAVRRLARSWLVPEARLEEAGET